MIENHIALPIKNVEKTCPDCKNGLAKVLLDETEILDTCETCGGTGKITKKE
jgi:DnaJ-class molecular chaperone